MDSVVCSFVYGISLSLSHSLPPRDGKYIPLPQRAREMGVSPGSLRGGASGPLPNRTGIPNSSRPVPPSSSPRSSSDKSSLLSVRGAYSPHHSQSSPTASGPPISSNQSLPHSLSHPQALSDVSRSSLNGGKGCLWGHVCP